MTLLAVAYIGARSYQSERQLFARQEVAAALRLPADASLAGARAVRVPTRGGPTVAAWLVLPSNRATIILLHGTNADRTSLLWEAQVLSAAGFGVLALDWPGYGLSEGTADWGPRERAALNDTLDWLTGQSGIDPSRIGAVGFSNGGYILTQVAASDVRLRAVVLAAAPTDLAAEARWEHRRYGWLSELPAVWAVRRSGVPATEAPLHRLVAQIAPRPVFILGGGADATVPQRMVRELFDAAREPKQMWIVPAAGHGRYHLVAPEQYKTRLLEFFSRTLLD